MNNYDSIPPHKWIPSGLYWPIQPFIPHVRGLSRPHDCAENASARARCARTCTLNPSLRVELVACPFLPLPRGAFRHYGVLFGLVRSILVVVAPRLLFACPMTPGRAQVARCALLALLDTSFDPILLTTLAVSRAHRWNRTHSVGLVRQPCMLLAHKPRGGAALLYPVTSSVASPWSMMSRTAFYNQAVTPTRLTTSAALINLVGVRSVKACRGL